MLIKLARDNHFSFVTTGVAKLKEEKRERMTDVDFNAQPIFNKYLDENSEWLMDEAFSFL